jgi:hypothetical protein
MVTLVGEVEVGKDDPDVKTAFLYSPIKETI